MMTKMTTTNTTTTVMMMMMATCCMQVCRRRGHCQALLQEGAGSPVIPRLQHHDDDQKSDDDNDDDVCTHHPAGGLGVKTITPHGLEAGKSRSINDLNSQYHEYWPFFKMNWMRKSHKTIILMTRRTLEPQWPPRLWRVRFAGRQERRPGLPMSEGEVGFK